MALRNGIAKLAALAEKEEDPGVLERIAVRLQDALHDKVEHLRAQKKQHKSIGTEGRDKAI